jgi:hypothetical protein
VRFVVNEGALRFISEFFSFPDVNIIPDVSLCSHWTTTARKTKEEMVVDSNRPLYLVLEWKMMMMMMMISSYYRGCPYPYIIWVMNNRPASCSSSETYSHHINYNNNNNNNNNKGYKRIERFRQTGLT